MMKMRKETKQIFIPFNCKLCNCLLFRFEDGFKNYVYKEKKQDFWYICKSCNKT